MGNFNRFYYPDGVKTDELDQNGYTYSVAMTQKYCFYICLYTKFLYAGITSG